MWREVTRNTIVSLAPAIVTFDRLSVDPANRTTSYQFCYTFPNLFMQPPPGLYIDVWGGPFIVTESGKIYFDIDSTYATIRDKGQLMLIDDMIEMKVPFNEIITMLML